MTKKPDLDKLADMGASPEAEAKVKKTFFDYFKKNEDKISFGQKIESLYDWVSSGKLSKRDKAIVIGALIYFISPIDAIPDMAPFLGFTDDLGVVYLVYNYLQNRALEVKNKK